MQANSQWRRVGRAFQRIGVLGLTIVEATRSIPSLGIQQPIPSGGTMIQQGQDYILTARQSSIFAGLTILLVVLNVNFRGDALRDALAVEERGAGPPGAAIMEFVPAPYRTRPATSADAEGILGVQRQIYREGRWFVGDGPPTLEALTRRLRSLNTDTSLYLVATAGRGEICGWLELHRLQPRRLHHVALLTLAVAPAHRRRGVASALLARGYQWARQAEVEKIQLNVRAGNEAAIALYGAQGFAQEGRERRQVREGDHYEDNLLMAKFL